LIVPPAGRWGPDERKALAGCSCGPSAAQGGGAAAARYVIDLKRGMAAGDAR